MLVSSGGYVVNGAGGMGTVAPDCRVCALNGRLAAGGNYGRAKGRARGKVLGRGGKGQEVSWSGEPMVPPGGGSHVHPRTGSRPPGMKTRAGWMGFS